MSHQLLNILNDQQKTAVIQTEGPILILAGAGSGKTMALTYKVAYLILEKRVNPENILMVTFTNKAAGEMKERIEKILKINQLKNRLPIANCRLPFAGTFHSLCAKLLRKHGKLIGISPQFVIYDMSDQKDAIKQIMKLLDISTKKFSPYTIHTTISQAKNELISATDYPALAQGLFQETVAEIFIYYQNLLKKNQALDFDDLLCETVKLFQTVPEILHKYQKQFQYILVDEYQDTNLAQYVLIKLLTGQQGNICVVGDASQSIYSWRGADFRNITKFQNDYPNTKTFNLEQNYRSSQNILDVAFSVISKNSSHPILKLWTDKSKGDKIGIFQARNEQNEAQFIVENLKFSNNLSDNAVLYRTNAQSRIIEEVLLHESIPYILIGGVRFYDRKEIKDVLSYLRLLVNPAESVSYQRAEKLGKRKLSKFLNFANSINKNSLEEIHTLELLDKTLQKSDYISRFNKENEEDLSRLENIKELKSVASEFPNIFAFLENIALVEAESKQSHINFTKRGRVTLMTLHSAKGLEFSNVFMVGMEEGLFPHSKSLLDNYELEEERRLCYVGITRAKKNLYLSHARRRLYFGRKMSNMISRFITDIPSKLLKLHDPIF